MRGLFMRAQMQLLQSEVVRDTEKTQSQVADRHDDRSCCSTTAI